jgi:plasmid stability protein
MGPRIVRNLITEVVRKLKMRARQYRRLLREEVKKILGRQLSRIQKLFRQRSIGFVLFAGRKFSGSSDLIR